MHRESRTTTGSVFRDLGFTGIEAENLELRSSLMTKLCGIVEHRGLTQIEAASLFGVSRPRVSDLVRGKIDRFSVEALVAMLSAAGVKVSVSVTSARQAL